MAFLLTITVPQDFFPAFAVTTFDNANFVASGTPEAMVDAVGISVLPGTDLAADQLEFPFDEGEAECLDVLATGGHEFATRDNARTATLYCDAVFLLEDALAGADGDDITAEVFAEGAGRIGRVENASNYLAEYDEGRFHGAAGTARSASTRTADASSSSARCRSSRGESPRDGAGAVGARDRRRRSRDRRPPLQIATGPPGAAEQRAARPVTHIVRPRHRARCRVRGRRHRGARQRPRTR